MEADRPGEPLFIPLDKLGVDWNKFSPQSIRIATSDASGREAFLPCQVVE
jgi:hypothetical protein